MKRFQILFAVLTTLLFVITAASQNVWAQSAAPSSASAQVPRLIRFSASAKDESGKPLTGTLGITFSIYKDQDGGAPLWMETQNVRADESGHYSVLLGLNTSEGLPLDIFNSGDAHWIGAQISGQPESPRVLLLSVPYALKALDAETLSGLPAAAFLQASPSAGAGSVAAGPGSHSLSASAAAPVASAATTGSGTANFIPLWTNSTTLGNSVLFEAGGNLGLGTTTPAAKLDSFGEGIAIHGTSLSRLGGNGVLGTSLSGTGVVGNSISPTGVDYGVQGSSQSPTAGAAGVNGFESATTGQIYGVSGSTNSTGQFAAGVSGFEGATTGQVFGVNGGTNSTGQFAAGVTGFEGATTGEVFGVTGSTNSTTNFSSGVNGNEGAVAGVVYGVTGVSSSVTTNAAGVNGFESASKGQVYGVNGNTGSTGPGAAAVNGFEGATTGQVFGVSGGTNSTGQFAAGVTGFEGATTGQVFGVEGSTNSSTNGSVGVSGFEGAATGTVSGVSGGTTSTNGSGVSGFAQATSGFAVGVVGQTSSPGGAGGSFDNLSGSGLILQGNSGPTYTTVFTVDAKGNGFYSGNLSVTGNLTKGSGSFKIDDPLDPANKYLSHSFVESPDMMNVYNGNISTDKRGFATVVLPEYFEALNRDFRYQLTVIGQFAQAIVYKQIANNRFVIRTSKPSVEVSWQVTGIRRDAYAEAHRIPVEEDKPEPERGYYLHPDVFGQPASKGIEAVHR